jgi:3' terminal RNA ribose 2'-O-methyltransferase Hen1
MEDAPVDPDEVAEVHDAEEEAVEQPLSLNEQRLAAVTDAITRAGARRVLDLGCGQGKLVGALLKLTSIDHVVGLDVSHRALEISARRLHLDSMAPRQRERIELIQGSLTYRDRRMEGFDAAAIIEVIEHLEQSRLGSFERVVFVHARPTTVIVTTPNVEYNVRFEMLPADSLRHRDHRFEWNRAEFEAWASGVAERHGYVVAFSPIGPVDEEIGSPTQMAVFSR